MTRTSLNTPLLSRLFYVSYLAIVGLLGFVRTDISVSADAVSDYLSGSGNWVAILAFMMLGVGSVLMGVYAQQHNQRLAIVLFIHACSVTIVGLTESGQHVHNSAALVAFASVPLAVIASSFTTTAKCLWLTAIIGSFLLWPVLSFGYSERISIVLEVCWLIRATFATRTATHINTQ